MDTSRKAILVPMHNKDDDRVAEDIKRTLEDRIRLMFELMRLAIIFSPSERPRVETDTRQQWWVLKRVHQNV